MKSEDVRPIVAFLTGGFLVLLLLFCTGGGRHPRILSVQVEHAIKTSKSGNIKTEAQRGPFHLLQDPAFNLELNPNKKFIILLASFRSGSSFLGKLFDSNPTIQYMFEPFHHIHIRKLRDRSALIGARSDHTESDLRMLYLQQMLHNCTVYITPIIKEKYRWCGTEEEHLHRFNSTKCVEGKLKYDLSQQEICRYRNTTVIKVIRLADLRDIFKIAHIRSADIKIIHLLRHPVALMMSRRTGGKFFIWDSKTALAPNTMRNVDITQRRTKMAWEVYNYCKSNIEAMKLAESDPWLNERYLQVSHYEMSLKPLETAERVYTFIGGSLSDHIREYIQNITGASAEWEGPNDDPNAPGKQALNVNKNSKEIITKWMKLKSPTLHYWDVYSIEAQCKLMFGPLIQDFSVDSISDSKLLKINAALDDLYDEIELKRN